MGRFSTADDITWHTFAIECVVRLKGTPPQWRVLTGDLNAYLCDQRTLAELLQRAHDEQRLVNAGVSCDAQNRDWILSAVITPLKVKQASIPSIDPQKKPEQLLF